MIDDDDFEDRFEEFCQLTDAQVDAQLEREMAEYQRWLDSLPPLAQYRYSRRLTLESCLNWRKMIREGWCVELFTEYLRGRQKRLVMLRIERSTGVYPGSA